VQNSIRDLAISVVDINVEAAECRERDDDEDFVWFNISCGMRNEMHGTRDAGVLK